VSNAVALPVLLPLATALLLLPFEGRFRLANRIAIGSGVFLLAAALYLVVATARGTVLVLPLGSWAPAVGVVWVADRLSAIMLLLAALTSLATMIYAPAALRGAAETRWFYPLHQLLLLGVNGSFVTGDLFNLFVFFEVMLVASFVLIALGGRAGQLEQAFPYVIINLVASALLFGGVGLVYGTVGTVNMAELAVRMQLMELPPFFWGGLVLVLVVFAIKAAVVPFLFWLPDAYPQAPLPVSAFFAGLLTKVGVYTLFRSFTLFTGPSPGLIHEVLLVLSAATMLLGVLGALGRGSIRGILSFHIVSQVGYMVFGLALFTPRAVAAGLFYVIHHIVVKTALFLAGGVVERVGRGGELGRVKGLARTHPWAGVGFFVPAMALAGIPPLSGFWGKLFLVIAGFEVGAYGPTAVAIVVSFITLASMLKIWFSSFWGAPEGQVEGRPVGQSRLVGPGLVLAGLSVVIGLAAPPLYLHAERTARELMDPSRYMGAVLRLGAVRASAAAPEKS
jgi:multicomponent Na+:H+ antiporter subunit D